MSTIKQINVANHGIFPFSQRLKERYGFIEYTDINEPCFFWGCLGQENIINNHKGLKVVKFLTPSDCETINYLNECENLFIINDPLFKTNKRFNFADIEFEFQDFSIFKPKILENKIYAYMRDPIEFQKKVLLELQRKIKYEIIFGGEVRDARYYDTLENLKKNYYDKCFLSINLSGKHGYTTVRELGYMGVKTIISSPYKFPSIIQLKSYNRNGNFINVNLDEIIEIIEIESHKIGTIQESLNPHNVKDEWIYLSFWEKKLYEKHTS